MINKVLLSPYLIPAVEMRYIIQRMHPGIRATGANDLDVLFQIYGKRLLELFLYGRSIGLGLPSLIVGPLIR